MDKIRRIFSELPLCIRWILVVNTIFFLFVSLHGGAALGAKVLLAIPAGLLIEAGAFHLPDVSGGHQYWRLISYAFLHGNLLHLAFNMLALWQIGTVLERELGWSRFLSVYFFTALIAIITSAIVSPETVTVGASGALFGLIGFSISFYHRIGGNLALKRRNLMVQWAAYAIMFGMIMHADNAAHIGGAVAGFVLGSLIPVAAEKSEGFFKLAAQGKLVTSIIGACLCFQLVFWARNAISFFSTF